MSFFEQELECCGASFEKNHISFLGLLTLSFPLVLICSFLLIVLSPLKLASIQFNFIKVLLKSNLTLISKKALLPRLKCSLVAKALNISPQISGMVYKYFNFSLYLMIWISLIITLTLIFSWI